MSDDLRVLAGDCTITFEDTETTTQRGDVVALVKPDNTVLVHDAEGYQPAAWLTRAEAVSVSENVITAIDGDRQLRVRAHEEHGSDSYSVSPTGEAVGICPDDECGATLIRTTGAVACTGCDRRHGLPSDASILTETCGCGLPLAAIDRGERFEVCVDRTCESLDERVQDAFDGKWGCPKCDGDLQIIRRGGLIAGCERYPDCEVGFSFPNGTITEDCGCGLPKFETASGTRCLDATCEAT
jgi:DNA topoisomerase-1